MRINIHAEGFQLTSQPRAFAESLCCQHSVRPATASSQRSYICESEVTEANRTRRLTQYPVGRSALCSLHMTRGPLPRPTANRRHDRIHTAV